MGVYCENMRRGLCLFILVFLSANIFASTYFISASGSDAENGLSIATAWASISKLNSVTLLPGDQIYFEGGQTFPGNIQLLENEAGDPTNPVIFSSYGVGRAIINAGSSRGFYAHNTAGFNISNLIFDGNSVATNTDAGIKIFSDKTGTVRSKMISITNVEVKRFGLEGITIYTNENLPGFEDITLDNLSVHDVQKNGILVYVDFVPPLTGGYAHKNVKVSNSEVYNVPGTTNLARLEGSGIVLCGTDGGVIENCVAHDNGQNNKLCGGPGGFWTLESNNIIIQHCESYRNHSGTGGGCDGLGFDLDGGVTNSILQYNYAHDNDGAGYLLGQYPDANPWKNNTVRYNISVNDAITNEGSIGLFKGDRTTMDGADIYNNTVYLSPQPGNPRASAAYMQDWNTGINHASFYNNIFITTGGVPLISIPVGYSAFFAGNIYWTSGDPFLIHYKGVDYSTLNNFRSGTGNEKVNGINTGINADPELTNVGSNTTIGYGNSVQTLNAYKISSNSSPANGSALDLASLFSIDPGPIDFWGTPLPGAAINSIGGNQFVSALPITLLSFNGRCQDKQNIISWVTAEELNAKSFELLYSSDGNAFKKIAEIKPKGSHSQYTFTNDSISSGDNYYQLKSIDLDGSFTKSSILPIRCSETGNKINVGPNPFSRSLSVSIESTSSGMASLILYSGTGKKIVTREVNVFTGSNQIKLDTPDNLAAGSYFLLITQQGKTSCIKLVKTGT